ncbi:MAG TPA: hypothetical protein VF734_05625 [Pseudonocardiaceae bacterium]
MSEPVPPSDALSGLDGTQLPDPMPTLPDPLAGPEQATWQAAPEFPPFVLPPLPDATAIREAIAAALGDDLGDTGGTGKAQDQNPGVAAAAQAASQATEQPTAPQANVGVPPPSATSAGEPAGPSTAGPSTEGPSTAGPSPSTAGPSPTGGEDRSSPRQPQVAAPIPAAPSQPRRTGGGLRYRAPKAAAGRAPVPPADLRRRIRREGVGLPLQTRSDGGATAFFLIVLIIIVLLLYFIITGLIESISSLFQ